MESKWMIATIFAAMLACCCMATACNTEDECGCNVKVNVFTYVEVACEGGNCNGGNGGENGNGDNGGEAGGNGGGATQGDLIPNYYNGGRNGIGVTGVVNSQWENPAPRIGLGSVEVKEGCESTILVGVLSTGLSRAPIGLWSIVVEAQDECFNVVAAEKYLIPHDTNLPAGKIDASGATIPGFKIFPVKASGAYYSVKLIDPDGNQMDHINYVTGDGLKIFSLADGMWIETSYSTRDIGHSLNF